MEKAVEKLNSEYKVANLSQYGKAVGPAVIATLTTFCEQNMEFAQAVEQSDKTVAECIESSVKGAGGSMSDLEVYKRAAKFYFEGADVHFNMSIDLGDDGYSASPIKLAPKREEKANNITVSLDSLLDF